MNAIRHYRTTVIAKIPFQGGRIHHRPETLNEQINDLLITSYQRAELDHALMVEQHHINCGHVRSSTLTSTTAK